MASAPKPGNGDSSNNNNSESVGKRKSRSKGSYLSKWLDKTMTMNGPVDYDHLPTTNWPPTSQFAPGYDPCRVMYGCTPEPMSLPTVPTYYTPAPPYYNHDYHRYTQNPNRNYARRPRRYHKAEEVTTPSATPNSMNYLQPKTFTDSQDYTSLPPIVTSVGDTNSNSGTNNDKENDNNNTNNRRYSDPGLPDVAKNGEVDSESDSGSDLSGSQVGSRLLTCLIDQITSLKAANERLNKELRDTRAELDTLRHHHAYLKSSGPSITATPNHAPLNTNGLVGGQYSPGFLADLVREIRDAARVREEAMFARVRALMLDRSDASLASSEAKLTEKYLEEIKSSLRSSEADKRCMMDRIAKLEDELRGLRANGVESEVRVTNGAEEPDAARLRKELADMRRAKQSADEHALKLERLVTQLRSKFNGLSLPNGPESLPSDPEHDRTRRDDESSSRVRRASINSSNASTVVFGPVTDL